MVSHRLQQHNDNNYNCNGNRMIMTKLTQLTTVTTIIIKMTLKMPIMINDTNDKNVNNDNHTCLVFIVIMEFIMKYEWRLIRPPWKDSPTFKKTLILMESLVCITVINNCIAKWRLDAWNIHYWQPAHRWRLLPWLANPGNPAMRTHTGKGNKHLSCWINSGKSEGRGPHNAASSCLKRNKNASNEEHMEFGCMCICKKQLTTGVHCC